MYSNATGGVSMMLTVSMFKASSVMLDADVINASWRDGRNYDTIYTALVDRSSFVPGLFVRSFV